MVLELEDLFQKNGYSEKEFRLDTAIKFYRLNMATLSRAAKIAGISKSEFEQTLGQMLDISEKPQETASERYLKTLDFDDPLRQAIKPIRKNVTIEDIEREQNYTGTDLNLLRQLAEDLAIEEPLDLLLAQLKS